MTGPKPETTPRKPGRLTMIPLAACLLAAGLLPLAVRADDLADLEAELRQAETGFAAAFARRDVEGFAAFVAPDAVFQSGPVALRGREAVMAEWTEYLTPPEPPFSWEPERVVVDPKRRQGMTTGPVHDPEGHWIGSFVSMWEKTPDGAWQVVFDVGPRCPPPPKPEPEGEAAPAATEPTTCPAASRPAS